MPTTAVRDKSYPIIYPETDGQPMSENTKQFRWILTLAGNLAALFRDREEVFVSGNQFWYPVEGEPEIRVAPDVYAVFGRPKGDRASYKQWEEENVPLTVVIEVLSPGNSVPEMMNKLAFYDEHGVEEYYLFDPEANQLHAHCRRGSVLVRVRQPHGFVSPRLGIWFDLSGPELVVHSPDGQPFLTFEELAAERAQAERRAVQAEQRAEREKERADQEKERADQEKGRADQEKLRADRLTELSHRLLRQEATPEEIQELQRLAQWPG